MNRKFAAAALLTAAIAPAAWAGFKNGYNVYIDTVNQMAYGSLGAVRNSADNAQYIGCSVYGYSSNSFSAGCYARDLNGVYKNCQTTVPALVEQIRALPSDAFLRFYWDVNGNCTHIYTNTSSTYEPKQP